MTYWPSIFSFSVFEYPFTSPSFCTPHNLWNSKNEMEKNIICQIIIRITNMYSDYEVKKYVIGKVLWKFVLIKCKLKFI